MISDFHFLRPWWLLALIPCGLVVWAIHRRSDATQSWKGIIAPNLLPFLLQGTESRAKFTPLHLIAIGWLVSTIAVAGPTWRREPAPFADDTSALAIVVKVTPSMMTEDVQPSRLARSVQKIHDLLELRKGASNSLVAYASSAHVVMPATKDDGIINTFAQALDPKIMPGDGDAASAAMRLADKTLKNGGSILWIADGIAPEQLTSLAAWRKSSRATVRILPPLLPGEEFETTSSRAKSVDAAIIRPSADTSDIQSVARAAKFENSGAGDQSDRWEESGFWLTPVMAALLLPFFRRGWMAQTANRA